MSCHHSGFWLAIRSPLHALHADWWTGNTQIQSICHSVAMNTLQVHLVIIWLDGPVYTLHFGCKTWFQIYHGVNGLISSFVLDTQNILTIFYENNLCMTLIMFKLPNDSDKFCKLWLNSSLHPTLSLILGCFSLAMLPSDVRQVTFSCNYDSEHFLIRKAINGEFYLEFHKLISIFFLSD